MVTSSIEKWALVSLVGDHPSLVQLNPAMELIFTPKDLSLDSVMACLWSASLSVRSSILLGHPIQRVVVLSSEDKMTQEHVALMIEKAPYFEMTKDWQTLAGFENWSTTSSTFLRLATLHKVLPEVSESVNTDKLRNPDNFDKLVWTQWLGNHHVDFPLF
jgi:hypothetical protein